MEETLVAAGVFRSLLYREKRVQFHSDEDGVEHLALCVARVYVAALYLHCCSGCVEVLILELSDLAAVHCVCVFRAEFRDVELYDSTSDLLVWSETDLDFAVLELRVLHYILHCVHDFSYSGLVVCSEQGCAVCGDEGLALVLGHFREVCNCQSQARNTFELHVASVVVLDDLRLDVCARRVRGGVDMRDESDCRNIILAAVGRNRSHDVAVFVEGGLDSHGLKFVTQHAEQVELLGCTRLCL